MKPFDFINSITYKKDIVMDSNGEAAYNPFLTNRALSQFIDCILLANEMNQRHHVDNKLQYDFLMDVVRKGKRYNIWLKSEEENIEAIQKFFGYSFIKAKETLS